MKKLLILGLAVLCGVASAQVNLTTIPQGTTLSGNELILMQQPPTACNGCTVTTTPAAINSYVRSQSPAIPTSQAPSAQVGTSAVTGATGYYMDAGSAPPLNLGITPTWTGLHTFNAGIALNSITSSAGIQMNGATGGAPGSGGINATVLTVDGVPVATTTTGCTTGSFTGTLTGFSGTAPTGTIYYTICGSTVWIYVRSGIGSASSNSTSMSITGVPGAILPSNSYGIGSHGICFGLEDAVGGAGFEGIILPEIATNETLELFVAAPSGSYITLNGAFASSGVKGLVAGANCVYTLAN